MLQLPLSDLRAIDGGGDPILDPKIFDQTTIYNPHFDIEIK